MCQSQIVSIFLSSANLTVLMLKAAQCTLLHACYLFTDARSPRPRGSHSIYWAPTGWSAKVRVHSLRTHRRVGSLGVFASFMHEVRERCKHANFARSTEKLHENCWSEAMLPHPPVRSGRDRGLFCVLGCSHNIDIESRGVKLCPGVSLSPRPKNRKVARRAFPRNAQCTHARSTFVQ